MLNRSYIESHEGHPHYFTDFKILSLQKRITLSVEDEGLARILRHLSDPTKFRIYLILQMVEEISVADLTHVLGITQSAVSHALSDLKDLGLVECHRCAHLICYSLSKGEKKDKSLSFLKNFRHQ